MHWFCTQIKTEQQQIGTAGRQQKNQTHQTSRLTYLFVKSSGISWCAFWLRRAGGNHLPTLVMSACLPKLSVCLGNAGKVHSKEGLLVLRSVMLTDLAAPPAEARVYLDFLCLWHQLCRQALPWLNHAFMTTPGCSVSLLTILQADHTAQKIPLPRCSCTSVCKLAFLR